MKIVHLVPSMESGGVEQVVMELGSGLSSRGVENIVVSGGGRLVPRLEKEGSRHILMPIGKKASPLSSASEPSAPCFRPSGRISCISIPAFLHGRATWHGKSCRRKTGPASSPAFTAFTPSTGTPPS